MNFTTKWAGALIATTWFLSPLSYAERTGEKPITFGGFVDTYYAFDFNNAVRDRQFTTQAARHNEFGINLAYVEAKLDREKVRGRLALQAGTSVNANYAGEVANSPQLGDLMRHIQEAVVGVNVADKLWLDAGIYFSHIGFESWISKDNWNYTRSLGAENSPYYQTGVKATYEFSPVLSGQLHVMNGWQNIVETNNDKAVGMQLAYNPNSKVSLIYNNFIGRENDLRIFNEVILRYFLTDSWQVALSQDFGMQNKPSGSGSSYWYATTLLVKHQIFQPFSVAGRLEYYNDKDQVLVTTGTANGFQTTGASVNLDWQLHPSVVWRNEIRGLFSKDAVFTGKRGNTPGNGLAVTSLAASF